MKKYFLSCFSALLASLFISAGANNSITADLVDLRLNINGETVELSSPLVMIEGKTYVPLRELAEIMGSEVYWNGEEGKVSIFTDVEEEIDSPFDNASPFRVVDENTGEGVCTEYRTPSREVLLRTKYYVISSLFHEGLASVEDKDGTWHYIDTDGNVVMSFKDYLDMGSFYDGMAEVVIEPGAPSKKGFINRDGELVIPCRYQWVSYFSEGLCAVSDYQHSSNIYYIDKNGERAFGDKEFISAKPFSEGFGVVQVAGTLPIDIPVERNKYTYIDTSGNLASQEWDACGDFHNGTAIVTLDGQRMRIDKNFEVVEYIE